MANSVVVFKALQLANEQRSSYGLRYNDYARYRKHCANRTHRLRSTLKMTHGRGREFRKLPPLTPEMAKDGHLQLLLLEAERAWAYSQELTSSALHPSKESQASTLRHSATGRFRRAVNWATQLLSLCQSLYKSGRFSAENLLQISAYTLILNGRFLRYRDEFDDALVQLSVARGILDELAGAASTSREQALAVLFADEIGPEIRYCAHELGRAKAYDIDSIVAENSSRTRNEMVDGYDVLVKALKTDGERVGASGSRKKLTELVWEGQPVPVRNPELVDVLLKVQEAETKLAPGDSKKAGKKGVASYDAILLALSDAEEVARKLSETQQMSGSGTTATSGSTRDIHFVHAYIVYQLLSRRIQRDLLLVTALVSSESSKGKPEQVDGRLFPALVKLLDTVLQSLNQMRTLSIVDESPDLAAAVEARLSYTKARRSLYLGRSYVPVKKFAEALTLIQHANIHVRETTTNLSLIAADPINASNPGFYPLSPGNVNELEGTLGNEALRLKREWFAFNGGSLESTSAGHKKPLFFDIAVNYVALDMAALRHRAGLEPLDVETVPVQPARQVANEETEAVAPEPAKSAATAKGGLGSLLGGWWGRS